MSTPVPGGYVARPYSSLTVGEELWGAMTVSEGNVYLAASIFNDPGPNHVNALHAERGRFGARVAHGPLLVGMADGVLGNALGATIVALLEQSASFRNPTFLGDTVITHWKIAELTDKASLGGGIAAFEGEQTNQEGELLVEHSVLLAIAEEAPWRPWDDP